jgi:hypothetical protein
MRTSLILAASIATILVLASVDRAAEAQSQPGAKSSTAKAKAAKAKPKAAKAGARRGFLPGAKGPGQCGTFMYWKSGKCVDARVTPAK